MDLKRILQTGLDNMIAAQKTNQLGNLTGSNALLYDAETSTFEAESSSHCPRVALLRRDANIQEPKSTSNFISNTHGRLFEEILRDVLLNSNTPGLEYLEEEEAEICITDYDGHTILTARPDKILRQYNKIVPVEVKTIQSASTAQSVFVENKPKLDALIQLSIYMYGHNTKTGVLLYAVSNWFSGYDFKTKQKWSITPGIKLFDCALKDGIAFVENEPSIVSVDKILQGIAAYEFYKKTEALPERPKWKDIYGKPAKFDGCTYCKFNPVCDRFDNLHNNKLKEFYSSCQKEIEL